MKQGSTIFLQSFIVLLGVGVLTALLWGPHFEGRNAHATLFEVYFKDPFLAYVYIASIPFFVALYKTFRVLGHAGRNKAFSRETVKALRIIKYCAIITAGSIVAADAYLISFVRGEDDPAGAVMLGIVAAFVSIIIATVAAVFESLMRNMVDMKTENDLTV